MLTLTIGYCIIEHRGGDLSMETPKTVPNIYIKGVERVGEIFQVYFTIEKNCPCGKEKRCVIIDIRNSEELPFPDARWEDVKNTFNNAIPSSFHDYVVSRSEILHHFGVSLYE